MSSRGTQGMRASRVRADGPLDHLTQPSKWGNYWVRSPLPDTTNELLVGIGTYGGLWQRILSIIQDTGEYILKLGTSDEADTTTLKPTAIDTGKITLLSGGCQAEVSGTGATISTFTQQDAELGGLWPEKGFKFTGALNIRDDGELGPMHEAPYGACIYVDPATGDTYIGSNFYHDGTNFRLINDGIAMCIWHRNGVSRTQIMKSSEGLAGDVASFGNGNMYAYTVKSATYILADTYIQGYLRNTHVSSSASDDELNAATPDAAITGTTYAQIYTVTLPDEFQTATNAIRLKWTVANVTGDTCKSKAYVNGVAIGTEKTGAGSFSEDLSSLEAGDNIEIWAYVTDGDESTLTAVSQCGTLSAVIEAVNPTW